MRSENSSGIRSRWSPIKEEFQDYPDPVGYVATWWACETVFNIFGTAQEGGQRKR